MKRFLKIKVSRCLGGNREAKSIENRQSNIQLAASRSPNHSNTTMCWEQSLVLAEGAVDSKQSEP